MECGHICGIDRHKRHADRTLLFEYKMSYTNWSYKKQTLNELHYKFGSVYMTLYRISWSARIAQSVAYDMLYTSAVQVRIPIGTLAKNCRLFEKKSSIVPDRHWFVSMV